jgi:anti-sigma factor RsiW
VRLLTAPLSCRELIELVTTYDEGALSRRDRRRFDRHIAGCPHCTAYLEQMRETIRISGRLDEDRLDPAARDELLAAFRDWKASSA